MHPAVVPGSVEAMRTIYEPSSQQLEAMLLLLSLLPDWIRALPDRPFRSQNMTHRA
mgnify:CR=1 FL=1